MTFSQFSVLTNTLQETRGVGRFAVNPPAHYGTSGWGVGYFVKGVEPPPFPANTALDLIVDRFVPNYVF